MTISQHFNTTLIRTKRVAGWLVGSGCLGSALASLLWNYLCFRLPAELCHFTLTPDSRRLSSSPILALTCSLSIQTRQPMSKTF